MEQEQQITNGLIIRPTAQQAEQQFQEQIQVHIHLQQQLLEQFITTV